MEYVEGAGFVLTKGDTWKVKLLVLQFVNSQGAWIDEVSIQKNSAFTDNDMLNMISKYVPANKPYRILERDSTETLIEIIN